MVAKMKDDLKLGEVKLTEIKGKREVLKNRARTAQKQAEASSGGGTAFDRFAHLVSEIEEKEEQAVAMAELEPVLGVSMQEDRDRQTNERFDRMLSANSANSASGGPGSGAPLRSAKDAEMDARLAALKAKLDKRPEGD